MSSHHKRVSRSSHKEEQPKSSSRSHKKSTHSHTPKRILTREWMLKKWQDMAKKKSKRSWKQMSTKLNCDIVRDLLPSYVDGLTSETTNEAVNEHLKECPECTEALKRMKEPEKTNSEPKAEVNYLKKIRRRSLQKGFIVCAIIVILALAAAALSSKRGTSLPSPPGMWKAPRRSFP